MRNKPNMSMIDNTALNRLANRSLELSKIIGYQQSIIRGAIIEGFGTMEMIEKLEKEYKELKVNPGSFFKDCRSTIELRNRIEENADQELPLPREQKLHS